MTLLDIADEAFRKAWWKDLKTNPEMREEVRAACQSVVDSFDDNDEYLAIVSLRRVFPR